jgi:hypothetical protein
MVEKYETKNLSIANVPLTFRHHINVEYPPHNRLIFEEWFRQNYVGSDTERVYLDIFWTSYWVNHNYGNDQFMREALHRYIATIDKTKKYFTVCQYDDGTMINWDMYDLDVLEFNMSKTRGVQMPLLCQPHPYKFRGGKKWFANFVGGKTHPIRNTANRLMGTDGYYVSYQPHEIEKYCRILYESMFTLCYRGYGLNSFRIAEAVQFGSIPVYISNDFIIPYDMNFEYFGVIIQEKDADRVDEILQNIDPVEVVKKQDRLAEVYKKYYTYEANLKLIINSLETECDNGEQG